MSPSPSKNELHVSLNQDPALMLQLLMAQQQIQHHDNLFSEQNCFRVPTEVGATVPVVVHEVVQQNVPPYGVDIYAFPSSREESPSPVAFDLKALQHSNSFNFEGNLPSEGKHFSVQQKTPVAPAMVEMNGTDFGTNNMNKQHVPPVDNIQKMFSPVPIKPVVHPQPVPSDMPFVLPNGLIGLFPSRPAELSNPQNMSAFKVVPKPNNVHLKRTIPLSSEKETDTVQLKRPAQLATPARIELHGSGQNTKNMMNVQCVQPVRNVPTVLTPSPTSCGSTTVDNSPSPRQNSNLSIDAAKFHSLINALNQGCSPYSSTVTPSQKQVGMAPTESTAPIHANKIVTPKVPLQTKNDEVEYVDYVMEAMRNNMEIELRHLSSKALLLQRTKQSFKVSNTVSIESHNERILNLQNEFSSKVVVPLVTDVKQKIKGFFVAERKKLKTSLLEKDSQIEKLSKANEVLLKHAEKNMNEEKAFEFETSWEIARLLTCLNDEKKLASFKTSLGRPYPE